MSDRFDEILVELRDDRAEARRERAEARRERAEMHERLDAWGARIDRLQDQTDENIRFLRELNRRGEIALQDLLRSQAQMREEIRAETAEIRMNTEMTKANTEMTKAHTRAIFAVIDRLEGGRGGAAAAT